MLPSILELQYILSRSYFQQGLGCRVYCTIHGAYLGLYRDYRNLNPSNGASNATNIIWKMKWKMGWKRFMRIVLNNYKNHTNVMLMSA